MDKLVSVVLPVYNGEEFLAQSIESVLKQSYKNLELIIVNDCSTDNTLRIIEEFAKKDSRIKIIHNSINQKLPKSLNIGFNVAIGEYWTWTSDDNCYLENALEEMVNYLESNPSKVLVCTDSVVIDMFKHKETVCKASAEIEEFLSRNSIGACFLYRATIVPQIGGYREEKFKVEDYDYWLKMGLFGEFGSIPSVLYTYRLHPNSLTGTQANNEVGKKTELLLREYIPQYIKKYPYLNALLEVQLRLISVQETPDFKTLFLSSPPYNRHKIYKYLRNMYIFLGDEKYSNAIATLGLCYRIRFWIFCKQRKIPCHRIK